MSSPSDNIRSAALDNARFIRPWRALEDRDDDDPKLQDDLLIIQKRRTTGKYDVYSTAPRKSDFTVRINTVVDYMKNKVLPTCETDVSGSYRICYDDMLDERDESNCLVFSKFTDQTVALMPDMYQMANYSNRGILNPQDPIAFEKKRPATIFAGSSTGSHTILENERVKACLWSLQGNRDIARFKITAVVQITADDLINALSLPIANQIVSQAIYVPEQLECQSITSIDGNTAAWDRPVWIMGSRSILFKKHSDCICWYYPFMKPGRDFVDVHEWGTIRPKISYYNSNAAERWQMTEDAHQFLRDYVDVPCGIEYTRTLLERSCELYKA